MKIKKSPVLGLFCAFMCMIMFAILANSNMAEAMTVTRRILPDQILFPNQSFSVYLDIVPDETTSSFSLEEYYPSNFRIDSVDNLERLGDGRLGLKAQDNPTTITARYQLSVPEDTESANYSFKGYFNTNQNDIDFSISGKGEISVRETTGLIISRSFSDNEFCRSAIVDVFLDLDPGIATFYLLEDVMPDGWQIVDDEGNVVPGNPSSFKSISLSPPPPRVFHYRVKIPEDAYGFYEIRGEFGDDMGLRQTRGEVTLFVKKFSDLSEGYWAEEYIYKIYNAGITTGCSSNPLMYCPQDDVTRAQMAAFIVRAAEGEPADNYCGTGSPFSDISPGHWACKYIKRLSELDITQGCGGDNYCPNDNVTRAQMAAFIVRAVEGEPPADYCDSGSPFSDVPSGHWACKYIKRLSELGITQGCGGDKYCPNDNVTRAQMAVFLARAFLEMD